MRRNTRIALCALAATWALLVFAANGFYATQSRTAQSTYGISLAFLAATSLGLIVWLIYIAILGTPDDQRKAATYKFRWMLTFLAGWVAGADGLAVLAGRSYPLNGTPLWTRLTPVHVVGGLGLLVVLYFRFRWLRIHADSLCSAVVRKRFERFEWVLVRVVWGLMVLSDISRGLLDGYWQSALFFLFVLVMALLVRLRFGRLLKPPAVKSPSFD